MRKILLFLLCATSLFAKEESPLYVGMDLIHPPFEMIDKEGKPAGISVDIANAFGEYLGRKVVIQKIPFAGLIPALVSGKIDVIISSLSATPKRKKVINFSDPYLRTGLSLLVGKNSKIESLEDADQRGHTIVVMLGTTGQNYADSHIENARVIVLDKESSCVLEVVQGKADAFLFDQLAVYDNWQKNQNTTRPILQPFAVEYWAMGLSKNDNELQDQANAFIKQYREQGGFQKLGERYLTPQLEAFKKLGIPFYFE